MISTGVWWGAQEGGAQGEGLACIDQQRPLDVCNHCIILQGIKRISAKLEQMLNMLP